jgi:hypothetical protein
MKKQIIIINVIMLLIALYTFLSLYKPSLLHFIDSNYINGKYVSKGGDHLTDELFLILFHYLNILVFYILNTVHLIKSIRKRHTKGIVIAIISILLMLSFYTWKKSITKNQFQLNNLSLIKKKAVLGSLKLQPLIY